MLGTDYIIAPKIPRGLAPAVEGLAREVLRQRPPDIYTFAAHHFEKLVQLRDKQHAAGTISGTAKYKSLNQPVRISDWTGLNNNDTRDYGNCESQFATGKCDVFVREATVIRKERMTSMIMRKLPKKKREATSGSGWSINETCKVLKKHKHANDLEEGKLWNVRANDKPNERNIPGSSQHSSPRSSKETAHSHLFRSSSVGSILIVKDLKCRQKEDQKKFCRAPEEKRDARNAEHECTKSCRCVNSLNRQKSVDQVESFWAQARGTAEQPLVIGRKRSRSLVNEGASYRSEGSFGNDELMVRSQHIDGERISRNYRDQWINAAEEQERKLREEFLSIEGIVAKSNLRLEKEHEEEWENSRCDLTQGGILSDAANPKSTDQMTSVVLPSVVTRQSSGKCTRNNVHKSNNEQDTLDNLILPPIASEALKSNKKEDHLALPSMLVAEDVRSNLDWYREEQSLDLEITSMLECANSDNELQTIQKESEELHLESKVNNAIQEPPVFGGSTIERDNSETEVSETDADESFKDSLNVTPEAIDVSEKRDSLELDLEGRNSQPTIDDNERAIERSPTTEEQQCGRSNELKRKLIEIETVERSIENTLVSSQTVSTCNDGPEESRSVAPSAFDLETNSSNSACKNEAICLIEKKEQQCTDDEPTKLNPGESGNSSDADDQNYDESKAVDSAKIEAAAAGEHSIENSEISFSRDTDTDRSNSRGATGKSPKEVDLSCYILTEGSPCEIPETVTTVIIPDKSDQPGEYVVEPGYDERTENNLRSLEKLSSSEAVGMQKEFQEQYQDDADLFGESVRPGIISSSMNGDARLLDNIKNAIRSSVYKDLENIREEEENESGSFLNNFVQGSTVSHSSSGESASAEGKDSIDGKDHSMSFSDQDQIVDPTKQSSVSVPLCATSGRLEEHVEKEEETDDTFPRETLEEEERKLSNNNRSSDLSLLNADSTPQVPELNLDSLQDTTISSFERSSSKTLERHAEMENGNISSCDRENVSSHSVDTLPSGRNMITLSSEDESEKICRPVDQDEDNSVGILACDKNGKGSCSVEEEIARELIENLIHDASMFEELTLNTREDSCIQLIDDDEQTHEQEEEGKEGDTEEKEEEEVAERMEGGPVERALLANEQRKQHSSENNLEIANLRHTGEFHDSLPLCIIEMPKNISTLHVCTLRAPEQTPNSCISLRTNLVENQGSTIIGNVTFPKSEPFETSLTRIIDISKNLRFFDNKTNWIYWRTNVSPNTAQAEQSFDKASTENSIVSLAEAIFEPGNDDLLEPLALDDTPKPIIIEEISDVDYEEDKNKERSIHRSLSICERNQLVNNDNSLINMFSDSTLISYDIDHTVNGKESNELEDAEGQADKNNK